MRGAPLVTAAPGRLVLPGDAPTIWHRRPWGGHLVRLVAPSAQPLATQLAASPDLAPAASWAVTPLRVELGDRVRVEGRIALAGATRTSRRALAIDVTAGAYAIDVLPRWEHDGAVYQILRLRPVGEVAPARRHGATARASDARPAEPPAVVEITAAARRTARALRFVDTDGGPLLVLPRAAGIAWHGTCDERGRPIFERAPCDYDRAIGRQARAPFALAVGAHRALVLPGPAPTAWLPSAEGPILIRHGGADSDSALVAAAQALPRSGWRASRIVLELPAGELLLVDAAADAARLRHPRHAITRVAAGRHAVDVAALDGVARDRGREGGFAVELVRLRRT